MKGYDLKFVLHQVRMLRGERLRFFNVSQKLRPWFLPGHSPVLP